MKENFKIIKKGEFFHNEDFNKIMKDTLNFVDELDENDPEDQKALNQIYLKLVDLRNKVMEIKISERN